MAGSQQRLSKEKTGGKRIDDMSFFAGARDPETVMPRGVHFKGEADSDGMGDLMNYEDTSEKIRGQQELGVRKQKSLPQRPLYRN